MKTSLKKAFLYMIVVFSLALTACNIHANDTTAPIEPSTPAATFNPTDIPSAALPVSPSKDTLPENTESLVFPDNGIIHYDGKYYNFQRVFDVIDEPTYYQGVIFTPIVPDTTAPIAYWFKLSFADGVDEELKFAGLANENHVDFRFTEHDNPKAGVMLASHVISGGLRWVMFLLVSEQL